MLARNELSYIATYNVLLSSETSSKTFQGEAEKDIEPGMAGIRVNAPEDAQMNPEMDKKTTATNTQPRTKEASRRAGGQMTLLIGPSRAPRPYSSEIVSPELHFLILFLTFCKPLLSDVALAVREAHSAHIGHLITVRGIMTKVSEVKPLLQVNAHTCDVCGSETFQEVTNKTFAPLYDRGNTEECEKNDVKGGLHMQTRDCRFSPFQEMADQVPVGHIPRSMAIHVCGNFTRLMNPGDRFILVAFPPPPVPSTGFQATRAELLTDACLGVHDVHQQNQRYRDMETTPELEAKMQQVHGQDGLFNKLAGSIAPEIYGYSDVKKALLLLLVVGVPKVIGDGMKIRGAILVLRSPNF
ncbi:DNA replication licensing factor MCM7 [Mycena indigotica]|uniref:DNA replication licensing factor MCM7 n=1 Tax=Mycena indigotica TaxID=2126181 RepID=A0A8H6SCJ7_9AGAR|nr:DNA replication licensing factor MCM7 [Mycena indigotica]KAF7297051.1 DNA replication licensing factor MCM7 [Mycena indigotica]